MASLEPNPPKPKMVVRWVSPETDLFLLGFPTKETPRCPFRGCVLTGSHVKSPESAQQRGARIPRRFHGCLVLVWDVDEHLASDATPSPNTMEPEKGPRLTQKGVPFKLAWNPKWEFPTRRSLGFSTLPHPCPPGASTRLWQAWNQTKPLVRQL